MGYSQILQKSVRMHVCGLTKKHTLSLSLYLLDQILLIHLLKLKLEMCVCHKLYFVLFLGDLFLWYGVMGTSCQEEKKNNNFSDEKAPMGQKHS